MLTVDFLVIGSGIAGLTYAIKVAKELPDVKIAIVTKSDENESNTKYAQGGIAVVTNKLNDSFSQHINDTIRAGDGLSDANIVEIVVTEGPKRLKELIEWGVNFDKENNGEFNLGLEGGHSENRILHHKDITGFEIEKRLLNQVHQNSNIQLFSQHFAIDLITKSDTDRTGCFGVYVFDEINNEVVPIKSKITLLATGGAGQIYKNTTNPTIATSDGIAMAHRAKAQINNMEFIQFHPTALFHSTTPLFLISEAVRGFGALLRNGSGELFMENYDARKELASRDIVSRAIDSELKKSGNDSVFLDCRHLNMTQFKSHFPNILKKMIDIGIDLKSDMIPVVPAAHYLCGGIAVNEFGQASIPNLYACGECAETGLHGGNRLASNSLLEALVFSERCFRDSVEAFKTTNYPDVIASCDKKISQPKELHLIATYKEQLQLLMTTHVGIIRTNKGLGIATNGLKDLHLKIEELYKNATISPQLIELGNMTTTAQLVVNQSMIRSGRKGVFYKEEK